MNLFAIIVFAMAWGLVGFFAGKLHERVSWNTLIHAGVIPTPKRRGR